MWLNLGLLLLHVVTGVFFTVTGARKLFLADVHAKVSSLFASHGVPAPLQWIVMSGEFLGGLGLLTGTLTHIAAAGLVVIMAGAYVMDTWPAVKAKQTWTRRRVYVSMLGMGARYYTMRNIPESRSKLWSNALCTPEAQLLIIVTTLALTGAGTFSLDALIRS